MTSSLVGSEMCIRDSHPRLPSSAGRPGIRGCRPLRGGWGHSRTHYCCRCLLYTSDAADDM
eukprot:9490707-Prorocentrum_lima.AAC.1